MDGLYADPARGGRLGCFGRDGKARVSKVMGIRNALRTVRNEPYRGYAWIKAPSEVSAPRTATASRPSRRIPGAPATPITPKMMPDSCWRAPVSARRRRYGRALPLAEHAGAGESTVTRIFDRAARRGRSKSLAEAYPALHNSGNTCYRIQGEHGLKEDPKRQQFGGSRP